MACTTQAAASHSGGSATPSRARGVMSKVTTGMAARLASKPTTENCPNNSSVSGASAMVTTPCSRTNPATDRPARPSTPPPDGRCVRPGSVANRMPTATKLSQKPGCISAHG